MKIWWVLDVYSTEHFLKKCPHARSISKFNACTSESAMQIAVTASGTPDRLTIQITAAVWRKLFFLRSALSCVITQNSADLVHLAAAAWTHVQNFVTLRLSPFVTLKLITASSQTPYRVLLTPSFTPFLNDTVHMYRVPSLSVIYPSWQIIFGGGHEANNRSNRTLMYWFFNDWATLLQVQKLYRCFRNR